MPSTSRLIETEILDCSKKKAIALPKDATTRFCTTTAAIWFYGFSKSTWLIAMGERPNPYQPTELGFIFNEAHHDHN
jgi:hypothetical protein